MGLLIRISIRNLFRQKRRNLLLGTAISIGMAILVIANAFSHGISDVLFNRIMAYVTGHVTIALSQGGNAMRPLFRDRERLFTAVRNAVPDAESAQEGIGIFARAIGNGQSDNLMLIGMDVHAKGSARQLADLKADFRMIQGAYDDLVRTDLENPVLISSEKAAYLNAKVGDVLRARFQDIHGRNQAARLTVAGVFNPSNIFMSVPVFLDLSRLRRLAGYGPDDVGQISVSLPDPKRHAVSAADALHAALAPGLAAAVGELASGGKSARALVLGFLPDSSALLGVSRLLAPKLAGGRTLLSRSDVLAGAALAESLGLRPGDPIRFRYRGKRDTAEFTAAWTVSGILPRSDRVPGNALLVNDRDFYGFYYEHWPAAVPAGTALPDSAGALAPFLDREWLLLPRTRTTEELARKRRDISRLKTKATTVDVQTMYESASMIIKLEYALNLITLSAVLILFFIIQVGVVNTLRMTIRERTREIGTIRAIGMQRGQVRDIFLLETFFLAFTACVLGVGFAFAGMWALGLPVFSAEGNPLGMLLVEGHVHFKPTVSGTLAYLALILCIAVSTAWFPARRAARLPAAEALRHFG
ncbi:MAG TPA: FtsX-like permease family protein [Fibrobacteria bacterium]|nr:FtsX-like permease family protein [Fibrobacteria bacterium]